MLGELLWVVHAGIVPTRRLADQEPGHLMNMRTLRADGTPSNRIDGGDLWSTRWNGPAHIVFGHDAISGLQQRPFATGLDTGCVYGKQLTALIWRCRQGSTSDRAKHSCCSDQMASRGPT